MNSMNGSRRASRAGVTVAVIAAATLAGVGCAPAVDRSGGELPPETVTLELASIENGTPPQISEYIENVERLSEGTLQISVTWPWGEGSGGFGEEKALADVAEGRVEMAWVGTRAFDWLGGNSLPALHAPLLIDSYALEAAVFDAGIVDEMLTEVYLDGVRPLAVLPGPLRRVLGIDRPMTSPSDFHDAAVTLEEWDTAAAVFAQLGVGPSVEAVARQDLRNLDASVQQLGSVSFNQYHDVAKYLSSNLNLYPRPLVVVVAAAVYDRLDPRQQRALDEAGGLTVDGALEASRGEDAEAAQAICHSEMQVVQLSVEQLEAFRDALAPVLDRIASEPASAEAYERIVALKTQMAAEPETLTCDGHDELGAVTPSALADTAWTVTLSYDELAAADLYDRGELGLGNYGTFTWIFSSDGKLERHVEDPADPYEDRAAADYRVSGDRLTILDPSGLRLDCRWNVLGDSLTITRDPALGACPTSFIVKPWTRAQQ